MTIRADRRCVQGSTRPAFVELGVVAIGAVAVCTQFGKEMVRILGRRMAYRDRDFVSAFRGLSGQHSQTDVDSWTLRHLCSGLSRLYNGMLLSVMSLLHTIVNIQILPICAP